MHELAVTESILEISLRHAQKAGAARITDIHLVIGALSSIIDDSVQFYWDTIAAGSIAQGATLHFQRIPAEMTCLACSETFQPAADTFTCPRCHSPAVKVTRGDEFRLDSIDIE